MPIVRVNMFEGRSLAKKRYMAQEITKIVAEVCEVDEGGVHVLIEEMSRDNWARGGTLHRDRGPKNARRSAFARPSFRSVSWVNIDPENVDAYLEYRRDHVNPAMGTMQGFRGSMLLRDLSNRKHFLVINHWDDEAAWRSYQATNIHDELKGKIRGELVQTMQIGRYDTTDLPASSDLDTPTDTSLYFTVSTHAVKPDNTEIYLKVRDTSVHPAMAEFPGFISSSAMESLDDPYTFLIVNSWESKEAADGYSNSPAHYTLRDQVRALLSEHSGTRQYELVML